MQDMIKVTLSRPSFRHDDRTRMKTTKANIVETSFRDAKTDKNGKVFQNKCAKKTNR